MTDTQSEIAPTESHASEMGHDKPSSFWFVWCALALLLAYPLSVGPVAKFYQNKRQPRALDTFYAPLGIMYDRSNTIRKTLDWYASLWGAQL